MQGAQIYFTREELQELFAKLLASAEEDNATTHEIVRKLAKALDNVQESRAS